MKIDQHEFHGLTHSAELIEAELRNQLAPLNLLPRQARVIEAIGRRGGTSQTAIASQFGITSASMSTMADRLVAAGYITRSQDPTSKRQNLVQLTEKGQALLIQIDQAWSAIDGKIAAVIGKDAPTFFKVARKLRDGLGGKVPGSKQRN